MVVGDWKMLGGKVLRRALTILSQKMVSLGISWKRLCEPVLAICGYSCTYKAKTPGANRSEVKQKLSWDIYHEYYTTAGRKASAQHALPVLWQ